VCQRCFRGFLVSELIGQEKIKMQAVFTGFDSAWGTAKSGALCNLLLVDDSLRLPSEPAQTVWASALNRARQKLAVDLQVWAIDQPLLVSNAKGCRPVERDLARALMGDFGCGAHSSNRNMASFAEDAPVWALLSVLQEEGYLHNPMAIPSARAGRFYFECYPHPAVIGLFDLDRILQYKVHHSNQADWQRLIRLVRSLAFAELPIRNVEDFVPENLPQNKRNEDNLDSIISAYTAAYWWKFGVHRSTVVGDLSTGYMVTPHSRRTLAALTRVFAERVNLCGTVATVTKAVRSHEAERPARANRAGMPAGAGELPTCDWVYFATPAKWSVTVTAAFVAEHKVIVRSVHNTDGQRVANVQHLKAGERILLVYGGHGRPYRALFSGTISASTSPLQSSRFCFDVFTCLDKALDQELHAGGYTPDPIIRRFTGIAITDIQDLRDLGSAFQRPSGNNAIWRWEDVFGR
jgi:predicted RNase H-like nuclease